MKPTFELGRFPDERVMTRVRFFRNSNFWIHDLEQATWVPTLEEAAFLKEVLDVINEHNEIKRTLESQQKWRDAH